ncbi:MAG: V4R domain-containing protein [Thermoplasmata archaeon]
MCVPGNVDMTVHRVNLTGESVEDYFDTVLARGFRWQPDQGPATGEGSHSPAVVWSPLVLELMEVLETVTLHPPAQHLCREIVYHAGLESAMALDRSREPEFPKAETLLAMPPIIAGAGFVTSELVYDDERERLDWAFDLGTVIAMAARGNGGHVEPTCAFFEGLGAGWAKGSLGLNLRISETDCIARGDDACRFRSGASKIRLNILEPFVGPCMEALCSSPTNLSSTRSSPRSAPALPSSSWKSIG